MYTPEKPQFYYIKVGLKGVKLYRYVFVMNLDEEVVYHRACGEDWSDCADAQGLIWIFTKHTDLFVEITVFQKIQFVWLQKINIYIFEYNYFFKFLTRFIT